MVWIMSENIATINAAQAAYEAEKKESGPMYLFWFFLGALGGHRFYLGDKGVALALLFTLGGGFGIGAFIDVFLIGKRLKQINAEKRREVFARYGLPA